MSAKVSLSYRIIVVLFIYASYVPIVHNCKVFCLGGINLFYIVLLLFCFGDSQRKDELEVYVYRVRASCINCNFSSGYDA